VGTDRTSVEERDVKLDALGETLEASIAAGGSITDGELGEALEARAAELAEQGF
jgi:antitoxin ParD1/3/4